MNYIWGGMIIVGILFGTITGNLSAITDAAINSSKDAVALGITMLGVMSFWMGLMEIATEAGIITYLSKKMEPIFRLLFPKIPVGSEAQKQITTNMIANFLGLGWAATPAGIKGIKELSKLQSASQRKAGIASNEMCTFLIINISSLQLIPINIIAYRTEYGSVNPTGILGAAIAATTISTIVGVCFCKYMSRGKSA